MKILAAILPRLPKQTADQLLDQANREMHKFHLGKDRSFEGALVHRDGAEALIARRAMKKGS